MDMIPPTVPEPLASIARVLGRTVRVTYYTDTRFGSATDTLSSDANAALPELPPPPSAGFVAFDMETTGLDPYTASVLLCSVAWQTEDSIEVIVIHVPSYRDLFWTWLSTVWTNPSVTLVAHYATFDLQIGYHHLRQWPSRVHCTMVVEQLLFAGLIDHDFSLEAIVNRRFGLALDKTIREGFIDRSPQAPLTAEEYAYAAGDAAITLALALRQLPDVVKPVYDLETRLVPIVASMEYYGIAIDKARLEAAIPKANALMLQIHIYMQYLALQTGFSSAVLFDVDGIHAFRPGQLQEFLAFCGITVPNLERSTLLDWDATHTPHPFFTTVTVPIESAFCHPLLALVDAYKTIQKLHGTYYTALLRHIHPVTGRIHPRFHQCGATATGRFSSSNPNFQNLPNIGKTSAVQMDNVRHFFIASDRHEPDHVFIDADFEGIELSILAALSGDEQLTYQILQGDIHTFVAVSLFGDEIIRVLGEPMTQANRKKGAHGHVREVFKRVSYATCYGSNGYSIFKATHIMLASLGFTLTHEMVESWVHRWKTELFPQTGSFFTKAATDAITRGYTESALGRRRFWDIRAVRASEQSLRAAMREGMNQPIQSTSADMTKLAMVWIAERLDPRIGRVVASIHDEIIVSVQRSHAEETAALVKECMERAGSFLFPNADPRLFRASPTISERFEK